MAVVQGGAAAYVVPGARIFIQQPTKQTWCSSPRTSLSTISVCSLQSSGRAIASAACLLLQAFNAGQVAKTLVGFTRLRHYDAELCALLADAAERDMANATGVHIAQIIWSVAHQRNEHEGVLKAAAVQVWYAQ